MGMLTLLLACNGSGPGGKDASDADGDGVSAATDCDESDASVFPGATETAEDGVDQDCDGVDPLAEGTRNGAAPDEGYGARVLITAAGLVVGAPFAGVAAGPTDGRVDGASGSVPGATGATLGAALAVLGDGTVLVGAPGVGRVLALDGTVLLERAGAGGVLAANGDGWVTSTATGAQRDTGETLDWDRRPDALALDGAGAVWAGFARGDAVIRTGATTVARATATDEAGFALLLADVGADGRADLVVGAPGAGLVYVLDPAALPASLADATAVGPGAGRFGAALAVDAAGVLYVGAPMSGAGVEGAVYAVEGGVATSRWTGAAEGDQLGFSLAAGRASLAMGAPGSASATGSVRVVAP